MNTRRFLASGVVLAGLGLASLALAAETKEAPAKAAEMTVQGEILDMACYVSHGAKGPDHAGCAKSCAKSGQPVGLLASDGTVYILYASHGDSSAFDQVKDLAGAKAEIKGVMGGKEGLKGIEVHSVKAL
jgi:hypothetical protein